jgi:hypothetical protein
MPTFPAFVKKHPVWSSVSTIVVFLVVTFPIWLAQVWTLVSDRPFAEDMAKRGWGWLVITPLYGWFCLGVGLVLVALAIATYAEARVALPAQRNDLQKTTASEVRPFDVSFQWDAGNPSDPRPEYAEWIHASFIVKSAEEQPVKPSVLVATHIDISNTSSPKPPKRIKAVIGSDDGWYTETHAKTHQSYNVPVALNLKAERQLWLDRQVNSYAHKLSRGWYLTTVDFFNHRQLRSAMKHGAYSVRVVLVIEGRDYLSDWFHFTVER